MALRCVAGIIIIIASVLVHGGTNTAQGTGAVREVCQTALGTVKCCEGSHLFILCKLLPDLNFSLFFKTKQVKRCKGGRGGVATFGTNVRKLCSCYDCVWL
jgi:hypothetical protein